MDLQAYGYRARILPDRGGSCIDFSRGGIHALRTPEKDSCYQQEPFLYGTPLLFFPNRISGGRFRFEDREYVLPINETQTNCFLHGTLHETAFRIEEQQADYVRLSYQATADQPYLTFPHAFKLTLEWQIREDGLHQRASFLNESIENMPVALAFHTTFRIPFAEAADPDAVRLRLDVEHEYGRNAQTYLPDGRDWEDFPGKEELLGGRYVPGRHTISRLFRMGGLREMRLLATDLKAEIRYCAGDTYRYWMVYNGGRKDLICVEPQSWISNCPNAPYDRMKHGFDFIAPGDERVYETAMSIELL